MKSIIKTTLLLLLLSLSYIKKAQNNFHLTYGSQVSSESINSVYETLDKGIIVSGYTFSFNSNKDIYIIKLDSNGIIKWTKILDGGYEDEALEIIETQDSCYVLCGFSRTLNDIYAKLIKLDKNGLIIFEKTFDTYKNYSVEKTSDGGLIIASIKSGYYIIKTDPNGNISWAKKYNGTIGNPGQIKQTLDGGYIVSGGTCLKLDSQGNALWSKNYDVNSSKVVLTNDNGFVFSTTTTIFNSKSSGVVFKTDSSGNVMWSKRLSYTNDVYTSSIKQTNNGSFITCGWTYIGTGTNYKSIAYIAKFNALGVLTSQKLDNSSLFSSSYQSINLARNDYFICGGHRAIASGANKLDMFLTKCKLNNLTFQSCALDTTNLISVSSATINVSYPTISITSGLSLINHNLTSISGGTMSSICSLQSVEEKTKEFDVLCFPNPNNGIFYFNTSSHYENDIKLYDSFGNLILNDFFKEKIKVDIHIKQKGIYFYRITSEFGKVKTGKIIFN
ncbi:MAG TPA: T9SS type A sorting domain-containing protein [Bacteroidia bacterium]|nr:T9SS type A sorting domain-containing protein [Bacteroidia bacterium]